VVTETKTKEAVRHLLESWFRVKARENFIMRLKKWGEWCIRRKLPEPTLHLRTMPKRWGSSHSDGRIYLNPELIHAPSICVDYVIAHEVCHLKHPNHDRAFFRLLDSVFPQRERVKQQLEESKL
jgi:predicted metal-dependent hydrolase